MTRKKVTITFPEELLREPIIHSLGQQFNLKTNIHSADISESKGWALVELEGDESEIESGIAWATSRGVRVDTIAEETNAVDSN